MKKAKEDQHKTNQQIIDSTGLSESTVKKFFSGHLSGPSIYDVTAIAIDLGLSLDELMEISPQKQDQSAEVAQLKTELAHLNEMVAEKDKAISRLVDRSHIMENEISTVRSNWKGIAYVTSGLSVLFGLLLIVYVTLDARNPNLGLIKGTAAAPIVYVAAFSVIGMCFYIAQTVVRRNAKRRKRDANNAH